MSCVTQYCVVYCLLCITVLCCVLFVVYHSTVLCIVCCVSQYCVVYYLLCITVLCCANNHMQIFATKFIYFHKNVKNYIV